VSSPIPESKAVNLAGASVPATGLLPSSISHFHLNVAAVVLALVTLKGSLQFRPGDGLFALVFGGIVLMLVITIGEVVLRRGASPQGTGLATVSVRPGSLTETLQRTLGLFVTLAACGVLYWLFPEYRDPFYDPFWRYLRFLAPFVVLLAPLYFHVIGQRQIEREDDYLQIGRFVWTMGRGRINPRSMQLHAAGWLVKAFFLPLMVADFPGQLVALAQSWDHFALDRGAIFHLGFNLTYTVDVLIAVVGYTMTLRVLGTQLRSVDLTLLGWAVTIFCYRPFFSRLVAPAYLNFQASNNWETALSGYPLLAGIWLLLISGTFIVHLATQASFGLRFSNLTNRGIITNGPYRFTKHPGYIAKNVGWWLTFVPFIPVAEWTDALRLCCMMLLLNGLYYLRAKTEERHLMRDPTYVAYAAWIDEHGVFRAWWRRPLARMADKVEAGAI
jgi:isoprenylcysteine carboxyl methyltransferase (ICMT) family protein YpbQ